MSVRSAITAGQHEYQRLLEDAWQAHLTPRAADALTVISLFAGCGGSSLGYSMAGYHELLAVEWDANAAAVFRLNFPAVSFYHGDITALSDADCLTRAGIGPGVLDVLDGSPPCQGFSISGKRCLDDPRNGLFQEYVRLLCSVRPKAFVMENVPGMIQGKMKLLFASILRALKVSGYCVKVWRLNAQYYQVPQSRERLIFLGLREDLQGILRPPSALRHPFTVHDACGGLSETVQDEATQHIWVDEVARHTKWIGPAARLHPGQKLVQDKPSGVRVSWDKPMPTIQKNALPGQPPYVRNSMVHPSQPRTPSIREFARCHSFPDAFMFVDALHHGMQRIGNAVPPLFMRAIATHVAALLRSA